MFDQRYTSFAGMWLDRSRAGRGPERASIRDPDLQL